MERRTRTIPPEYFDEMYSGGRDPWGFRTSPYERDKYAATLAALGRDRYPAALEVGCSVGVFTRALATRCDRLLALDPSPHALDQARAGCADRPNVTFERRMVPGEFPDGRFDLVVLSEVLYYLVPADLDRVAAQTLAALRPGAEVVLCHWLGDTDYPQGGAEASDRFLAATRAVLGDVATLHDDTYRLVRARAGA